MQYMRPVGSLAHPWFSVVYDVGDQVVHSVLVFGPHFRGKQLTEIDASVEEVKTGISTRRDQIHCIQIHYIDTHVL